MYKYILSITKGKGNQRMKTRTFFSKKRAEDFVKYLNSQGIKKAAIWNGRDGFGQVIYTVKWN